MTKRRLTEGDYTDMALAFEHGDIHPIEEPRYAETALHRGRPSGQPARGSTPVRSFRLPTSLIEQLERRAHAEHVSTSEIARKALAEYLAHP